MTYNDVRQERAILDEILRSSQYQPRGDQQSSWEKIKSYLLNQAIEFYENHIKQSLEELANHVPVNSWFDSKSYFIKFLLWLLKVGIQIYSFLEKAYPYLLFFSVCFLAYFLLKRFGLLSFRTSFKKKEKTVVISKQQKFTFSDILKLGETKDALFKFRLFLREELSKQDRTLIFKTDREIVLSLKDSDPKRGIFKQIQVLFEESVFAKRDFKNFEFQKALKEYQELAIGGVGE